MPKSNRYLHSSSTIAETRINRPLLFTIIGVTLVAAGVIIWLWGINILHWFTTSWRESAPFWLGLAFTAVPLGYGLYHVWKKDSYYSTSYYTRRDDSPSKEVPTGRIVLAFVIAAVIFIATLFFTFTATYFRLNQVYHSTAEVVENQDAPNYNERAPFEVAVLTAEKALLNTTGDAEYTKSLAEVGDNGEWNTLVRTRGPFAGYESVQNLNLPLFGTPTNKNVSFCEFNPDHTLRDSGALPHNNLSRAIYGKVPLNVDYDGYDIYSYCDGDTPMVVVPLKQINGFLFPTWSYYGVATYNGHTGEIRVLTDAEDIQELPGSVYPETLATMQRISLMYSGSLWESVFMNVAGYETATDNSDVKLKQSDNSQVDYVTTLRPRGSSTSIVAVSTIASNVTPAPGELNPLIIHELPEEHIRPANSTLVDEITTRYAYMPDIASGTSYVFEITSGQDGGWVASIGKEQSVNYRAYITPEGSVTLYDRDGNLIPQQGGSDEGNEEAPIVTPNDNPLEEMSTEELETLGKAILEELANRSGE